MMKILSILFLSPVLAASAWANTSITCTEASDFGTMKIVIEETTSSSATVKTSVVGGDGAEELMCWNKDPLSYSVQGSVTQFNGIVTCTDGSTSPNESLVYNSSTHTLTAGTGDAAKTYTDCQ